MTDIENSKKNYTENIAKFIIKYAENIACFLYITLSEIKNDKTYSCTIISVISLFIVIISSIVLVINYISKINKFNKITNPLISESPSFYAISTGKIYYGILLALVLLSLILSIFSIYFKFSVFKEFNIPSNIQNFKGGSECIGKNETQKNKDILTIAILIIISTIIQIPFIISFYNIFIKKEKYIADEIKDINNLILDNIFADNNLLNSLQYRSTNDYIMFNTIDKSLNSLFTDEDTIDTIFEKENNLTQIIITCNMYINYHNNGFDNVYLEDALTLFTPKNIVNNKLRKLTNTLIPIPTNNILFNNNPFGYLSYNTPYLIDYSEKIITKISKIITNKLFNKKKDLIQKNTSLLTTNKQISLQVGAKLYDDKSLIETDYNQNISKYDKILNNASSNSTSIINKINIKLSNIDLNSITNEYENLMTAFVVTQIPALILGIYYVNN